MIVEKLTTLSTVWFQLQDFTQTIKYIPMLLSVKMIGIKIFITIVWIHAFGRTCFCAPTPTANASDTAHSTVAPNVTSSHRQIYERLAYDMTRLSSHHMALYHQYLLVRFPDEPEMHIDDLFVEDIPNSNGLPTFTERHNMTHGEILLLHYANLLAYESGIVAVSMDEESRPSPGPSYLPHLQISITDLGTVRQSLEQAMRKEELHSHVLLTPVIPSNFIENVNNVVRNLRNLYVLQELHYYLSYVSRDFNRILHHYTENM